MLLTSGNKFKYAVDTDELRNYFERFFVYPTVTEVNVFVKLQTLLTCKLGIASEVVINVTIIFWSCECFKALLKLTLCSISSLFLLFWLRIYFSRFVYSWGFVLFCVMLFGYEKNIIWIWMLGIGLYEENTNEIQWNIDKYQEHWSSKIEKLKDI